MGIKDMPRDAVKARDARMARDMVRMRKKRISFRGATGYSGKRRGGMVLGVIIIILIFYYVYTTMM